MHRRLGHSNYDGKIAGLYDLEETLGRGHFAVVKLARHVFTGEKVAVKVIDKSKLDEVSKAHLFQEVRCMKLVQHPNVVRLYEVIDTQTKLYLILELGDGGDLYDYIMRHDSGLSEELARTYFRQIVKAISYCHRLHVVHRDLKPENVVFFEKLGMVKLTDFGFSNRFFPGQKLETSCGSLAYSAPEILLGDSYDAPAVDVWSLGVILYMLVCGQAPFQEANDSETLTMIMDCKYSIAGHVSDSCKKLIARMLVRQPEGRATLDEIAEDPWLTAGSELDPVEALPLVSRHQVSEDHHNIIVTKMANGNIATKEEILEALDKNAYNHITATYFLLAERKLRASRQEQREPLDDPLRRNVLSSSNANSDRGKIASNNQSLLAIPRMPGELSQNPRTRKCSIVQEEDEDDMPSCSRKDEHGSNSGLSPFNRRGSRSEGKLSHILQERLPNLSEKSNVKTSEGSHDENVVQLEIKKSDKNRPCDQGANALRSRSKYEPKGATTFLTDSSTAPTPLRTSLSITDGQLLSPKYKTMPPPSNVQVKTPPKLTLNEILKDTKVFTTDIPIDTPESSFKLRVFRKPGGYEQRHNKFHKTRTTSCSSSDASDDDSENRKKRAHKMTDSGKPSLPPRRDSHDDSSDSQDPSGGGGGAGGARNHGQAKDEVRHCKTSPSKENDSGNSNDGNGGRTEGGSNTTRCANGQVLNYDRRHCARRRRSGETRLRESQSLNRITEVQEAESSSYHATCDTVGPSPLKCAIVTQARTENNAKTTVEEVRKTKRNVGARLLPSWSCNESKVISSKGNGQVAEKGKYLNSSKNCGECKGSRKMELLSRYLAVQKKLCMPIPGFFGKGKLYKARSCGNIVKDQPSSPSTKSMVLCNDEKWPDPRRTKHQGSDNDINQNLALPGFIKDGLDKGCIGLPTVCHVHFGDDAARCCSLC